jgi:site-specific DNA-cytosine methylase
LRYVGSVSLAITVGIVSTKLFRLVVMPQNLSSTSSSGDSDYVPCQDVSAAGKRLGMDGDRSGPVWRECFRVLSIVRPKLALIENVAMLINRGLRTVLADLASVGYDAEWDVVSAAACGGTHLRERVWIVARPRELAGTGMEVFDPELKREVGAEEKLTRAGRMIDGTVYALDPIAPKKTKRHEGWSYWVGVDLLDVGSGQPMFGTPMAHERTFEPRKVHHGVQLANQVADLNQSSPLWPTPNTRDWKDNGPSQGARKSPNLGTMVHRASEPLLPTPTATMGERGGRGDLIQVVRGNPSPSGHFSSEAHPLWPTPKSVVSGADYARTDREGSGGDDLATRDARSLQRGSLNPTWVETLMGVPVGWTMTGIPNGLLLQEPWWEDSDLPKTTQGRTTDRKERLRALGNSVFYPCAYYVLDRALAATPSIGQS